MASPRRRPRRPVPVPTQPWIATLNGYGVWVLRDKAGNDPLGASDPLERCRNIHIAARAKTLEECLAIILKRFTALQHGLTADQKIMQLCWGEIYACRPPLKEVTRLLERRGQSEFDLAA